MFRSLSHQLHGTKDKHSNVCLVVQKVMEEKYNSYWIQIKTTFSQHVQLIKNQGVWGTQVELLAASDYYQLPIYVCAANSSGTYQCHTFKPEPQRQPISRSKPAFSSPYQHSITNCSIQLDYLLLQTFSCLFNDCCCPWVHGLALSLVPRTSHGEGLGTRLVGPVNVIA